MKTLPRLLTLLLLMGTMTCWAYPAAAARLAHLTGQAGGSEVRKDAEFKLSDQSQVEIQYNVKTQDDHGNVKIRVHRKQGNGKWLIVNTILRTDKSINGTRPLTLPAGDYKIEVIAKHATYDVAVGK